MKPFAGRGVTPTPDSDDSEGGEVRWRTVGGFGSREEAEDRHKDDLRQVREGLQDCHM